MSTPFQGFIGPSYQYTDKYAAIERTVNWYLTANESEQETKFRIALDPCPGNAPFSALPVPFPFNGKGRGIFEYRGQVFGVSGDICWSMDASTGEQFSLSLAGGPIADDGKPVCWAANANNQIAVASAGILYVIRVGATPSAAVFGPIPTSQGSSPGIDLFGASYCTSQDGYILVVTPNSNQFQISGNDAVPIGDLELWSAANISIQEGQNDLLRTILSSREYVRLMGARRSQVLQNVGPAGIGGFPFQSYNETFIETGIAAPFSLADMGDSLIWIGQDSRGTRACWRDGAFQPQRISTFAVEQFWQGYSTVEDAIAFPFIWMGHLFYQITFPAADKTWLYDATTSQLTGKQTWSERQFNDSQGNVRARSEQFHCYAQGKHLVLSAGLDGNPGAVYQYSATQYTDCAMNVLGAQTQQQIVRERIAPHLFQANKRVLYNRIELELTRGVGLDGPPAWGTDPQIYLSWSKDGGNTWGTEYNIAIGKIGEFGKRVLFNRIGAARDMVFRVRYSDPTYIGIVAAELDFIVTDS